MTTAPMPIKSILLINGQSYTQETTLFGEPT